MQNAAGISRDEIHRPGREEGGSISQRELAGEISIRHRALVVEGEVDTEEDVQ